MKAEEWKERYGVTEEPGTADIDDLEEISEIPEEDAEHRDWRRGDGNGI